MASLDPNAHVLLVPAPPPLLPLPALAVAARGPAHTGADAVMLQAVPPQPGRPDNPAGPRTPEGRPYPYLGAMRRSRNTEQRIVVAGRRGNPANLVRRVLPLVDGSVADAAAIAIPVGRVSTLYPRAPDQNVLFARGRPEPDRTVAARQHGATGAKCTLTCFGAS